MRSSSLRVKDSVRARQSRPAVRRTASCFPPILRAVCAKPQNFPSSVPRAPSKRRIPAGRRFGKKFPPPLHGHHRRRRPASCMRTQGAGTENTLRRQHPPALGTKRQSHHRRGLKAHHPNTFSPQNHDFNHHATRTPSGFFPGGFSDDGRKVRAINPHADGGRASHALVLVENRRHLLEDVGPEHPRTFRRDKLIPFRRMTLIFTLPDPPTDNDADEP